MSATKLSAAGRAVLTVAASKAFMTYSMCLKAGGNGSTLAALVARGLLTRNEYKYSPTDWSITATGRAAIAESTGAAS